MLDQVEIVLTAKKSVYSSCFSIVMIFDQKLLDFPQKKDRSLPELVFGRAFETIEIVF